MRTLIVAIFLLIGKSAFAYESGTCTSLDPYYGRVEFKVEESSDLTYATEFAKDHKGQLITDKDGGFFSVIWSEYMAAPATGYNCTKISEE